MTSSTVWVGDSDPDRVEIGHLENIGSSNACVESWPVETDDAKLDLDGRELSCRF